MVRVCLFRCKVTTESLQRQTQGEAAVTVLTDFCGIGKFENDKKEQAFV